LLSPRDPLRGSRQAYLCGPSSNPGEFAQGLSGGKGSPWTARGSIFPTTLIPGPLRAQQNLKSQARRVDAEARVSDEGKRKTSSTFPESRSLKQNSKGVASVWIGLSFTSSLATRPRCITKPSEALHPSSLAINPLIIQQVEYLFIQKTGLHGNLGANTAPPSPKSRVCSRTGDGRGGKTILPQCRTGWKISPA